MRFLKGFYRALDESHLAFGGLSTKVSLLLENFWRAFRELLESLLSASFQRAFEEFLESFWRVFGELLESYWRAGGSDNFQRAFGDPAFRVLL